MAWIFNKDQKEVAKLLAPFYNKKELYLPVATLCDELFDRSGALLGYVREEARILKDGK